MPEQGNGNTHRFKSKGYESIPRELLQDTERLSFGAIGLLSYMLSKPDNWTFHKTWLYETTEIKDKRRKITGYWDELVDACYILQLEKRVGSSPSYEYYFNDTPFTADEIQQIEQENNITASKRLNQHSAEAKKTQVIINDEVLPTNLSGNQSITNNDEEFDISKFLIDETKQLSNEDIEKMKLDMQEITLTNSWSQHIIKELPTGFWVEVVRLLKRTTIVFDHDSLDLQLNRFVNIYRTKGIAKNRMTYYFLNGLQEYQADVTARKLTPIR